MRDLLKVFPSSISSVWLGAILCCAAAFASGCGGYHATGRVIEGDYDFISVVPTNDPRLAAKGVPGARISFVRDPGRLNESNAGSGTSDGDGRFRIPLDAFGAGWMDETWLVRAVRSRFGFAEGMVKLPSPTSSEQLLIVIRRASDQEVADFEQQRRRGDQNLYQEADLWRTP